MNLWKFIGINKVDETEADKLFIQILSKGLNKLFEYEKILPNQFDSFDQFIKYGKNKKEHHSFFYDWLDEYGNDLLKLIGTKSLPDTEEVKDFLRYKDVILEFDIESKSPVNLIISLYELIVDTDSLINELILKSALREGKK